MEKKKKTSTKRKLQRLKSWKFGRKRYLNGFMRNTNKFH